MSNVEVLKAASCLKHLKFGDWVLDPDTIGIDVFLLGVLMNLAFSSSTMADLKTAGSQIADSHPGYPL